MSALHEHDQELVSGALWGVLPAASERVVAVAMRVLCFLCAREEFYFLFNNQSGIEHLIAVALKKSARNHDDDDCEFHCAVVLRACCETVKLVPSLVRCNIIDTLCGLCRSKNEGVAPLGICGLEDIIRFPDAKKICASQEQVQMLRIFDFLFIQ